MNLFVWCTFLSVINVAHPESGEPGIGGEWDGEVGGGGQKPQ